MDEVDNFSPFLHSRLSSVLTSIFVNLQSVRTKKLNIFLHYIFTCDLNQITDLVTCWEIPASTGPDYSFTSSLAHCYT